MTFAWTEKQIEARHLLGSSARHILLRGGSRSGKTFVICDALVVRMLKAPGSTHAILRYRFNHLKESIISGTIPSVMQLRWPNIKYEINRTDWYMQFENSSKMLFGGLDDKERTEKILGQEHSSLFLNEISQIPYASRNKAVTRLAQKKGLINRAYYDENPPTAAHWSYPMWMLKQEPLSRVPLSYPDLYATLQMNPGDNAQNLDQHYIQELESLPERDKRRFLYGEFLSELPGSLWTYSSIDSERRGLTQIPPLIRIVVAIDPSGCAGDEDFRSDEIGIVCAGIDAEGEVYILEDATLRGSPQEWAKKAVELYQVWSADTIIAERNYGGAMVENTIRTVWRDAPFREVVASRGKIRRAEPVSALYEKGRVHHVGVFAELEEQLLSFTTDGYEGSRSPDRADACIWAVSDLAVRKQSSLFLTSV
jgi:PBSX family phage terminase large subunit